MSNPIEKIDDYSFLISYANSSGELFDSSGNPPSYAVQSILDKHNVQVPDGMSVSLEVSFRVSQDEIVPNSGEIIVLYDTETGINPVSTGAVLTSQELDGVIQEHRDDIYEKFEDVINNPSGYEDYDDTRWESDYGL